MEHKRMGGGMELKDNERDVMLFKLEHSITFHMFVSLTYTMILRTLKRVDAVDICAVV